MAAGTVFRRFYAGAVLLRDRHLTHNTMSKPCKPSPRSPIPGLPSLRTIHVTPYRTFSQSDHPASQPNSALQTKSQSAEDRRRDAQIPRYKRTGGPLGHYPEHTPQVVNARNIPGQTGSPVLCTLSLHFPDMQREFRLNSRDRTAWRSS